MKLVYPAVFTPYEKPGDGFVVMFPDLPGCVTGGDTPPEALFMAEDAASGWILTELEEGKDVPSPSPLSSLKCKRNEIINLIPLDMDRYAEKYGSAAVKKTLTIPAFMNTFVTEHAISCSRLLQDAISQKMIGLSQ